MQAPKIALITGASRGLGRNTALQLAAQGVDLILTYRSQRQDAESLLAEVQKLGRKAVILRLEVGDSESFPAFAAEVRQQLKEVWNGERFDFLVNNAGIGAHALVAETSLAQFDELMRVHLKGPFFLTQALLPLLNDGGRIVNLSSGLTRFALPGYGAYAAMKGGIEVLTRYLAKELGPRGIAANVVAPGAIETDFGGGPRARPGRAQPVRGQPDCAGPRRCARRHRPGDCLVAGTGRSLDQCPAHRGLGWHVPLIKDQRKSPRRIRSLS